MATKVTAQNIMTEIGNIKNWKRTSKKNYDIYVCAPRLGTKVHNRLEGSNYVVDDKKRFVLSGTVGEQWTIDAAKLAKTYCFMDGTPITAESLNKKSTQSRLLDWTHIKTLPGGGGTNWAFHLPLDIKNFPVQTSWGDTLYANRDGVPHGVGDFLVCADANGQPNLNDCWVVNGEVFPTTYDMRAFPGLVPAGKKAPETPVPKSLISDTDKVKASVEGDKDRIKKFMQALNKGLRDAGQYTKVTHDSADGKYENYGGNDLWTIGLDKDGNKQVIIGFKDGKLSKGTASLSLLVNDLEIIKPTQIKSLDHARDMIIKTQESLGGAKNSASRRIQYQIVGRYMNGSEVTGYHLQSIDSGKSGKFTKGQVCFLVGRKQITNCTAQLYKDGVLLRGNGMSLNDLPIINEDGELRNGTSRKGVSAIDAVEMFNIVGAIKSGRNTVGYVVQNAGCGIKKLKRAQVIQLAQQGKIGNARVQTYNGTLILRGVGCDLGDLPAENITKQVKTEEQPLKAVKEACNNIDTDNTTPNTTKKKEVTKLISISQLYYKGNGKFEVALVDFGVSNSDLSRQDLVTELEKFKAEVKAVIGHNFYNTDDVLDINIHGKNFVYTFDDPYYTSIADYNRAARRLKAKFYLDKNVNITDENSDDLPANLEAKARQELAAIMGH